jgi:hypothetical protein
MNCFLGGDRAKQIPQLEVYSQRETLNPEGIYAKLIKQNARSLAGNHTLRS